MRKTVLSVLLTLAIIYIVPFVVYSAFSAVVDLKPPEGAPVWHFLLSVLVSKIGTAVAFVLIFFVARDSLAERWLLYAFIWWVMFVLGEVGEAIGPDYSWTEALAGVISEAIYFPLAAFATSRLLAAKQQGLEPATGRT